MVTVRIHETFRPWRVLMAILAVSIFAGMAMQLAAILSFAPAGTGGHGGLSIRNALHALFPAQDAKDIIGRRSGGFLRAGPSILDRDVVLRLRDRYGKDLGSPRAQVQVVEDIKQVLEPRYPERYQDMMGDAIRQAFPDSADRLVKMAGEVALYDAWLQNNWDPLFSKSRKEKQNIIWGKRREIFGSDAEKIWPEEQRTRTLDQVVSGLNKVTGASFMDKFAFFEGTIRQEYDLEANAFIKSHQKALLDRFLKLESVQADLRKMPSQERRKNLRAIRKALGVDEGTLAHWDALEKTRDDRWEKGLQYMRDRQEVLDSSLQGGLRELVLDELRKKYFGSESAVVAAEEKAGYYRLKVKRVYGLN